METLKLEREDTMQSWKIIIDDLGNGQVNVVINEGGEKIHPKQIKGGNGDLLKVLETYGKMYESAYNRKRRER
jgi:hypothetical protein